MNGSTTEQTCLYGECHLPENNNYYLGQLAYCSVALLLIMFKVTEFTFFNISLFFAPIVLELAYNRTKRKGLDVLIAILLIADFICLGVSCIGIFSSTIENGTFETVIDTIFGKFNTENVKKTLLGVMICNILYPFALWIGRPCKKSMKIVEVVTASEEVSV